MGDDGPTTTRAENETSDEASERRYRALIESMDDGFCIIQLLFDEEGRPVDYRFLEANATFEEHTGLKGAVGKTARELVPDLDTSWFELYGHVALTGEATRFENHAPAMDERWFEVFANRVGPPELRQVGLVFKNITARKVAEARVQESEARFRNMADHAPVMLWVTDERGRCVYLNRRWYELTGQTEATGLGAGWLEAVHPDDAPRAREALASATAARGSFRLEYRLRSRDGEHRWVLVVASPRFDADGAFLGHVGSVIDITERREIERQRASMLAKEQLARSRAEEANRLKDEFLATVSHELRTPLSAMLGWVQLLRADAVPADRRAKALETIERNARSQAELIEDLLDVGRILSGKLELEIAPVEVSRVAEQAIESVRPAAEAKGVRLEASLGAASPVMGDAGRLQQVVWNLLSNAVKFTPRGGRVQVFVDRREAMVELAVADTGQGISDDFLPHVFERFRQGVGGSTRKAGGLGLGLSIVQNLVEAHEGTIVVSSEGPDRGATFVVRLPLASASRGAVDPAPTGGRASAQGLECPPELGGLHVLVVDDEADSRELVRALLESCGARVTTAASAAEGLRAIEESTPDVLVSDIGMPDQDGYAFLRAVRAHPDGDRLPAVALTAYARVEDKTRALLSGFQHHLPKPVQPPELLEVIASLTDRHPSGG